MANKKDEWKITFKSEVHLGIFLDELKKWQVNPSLYKVEGNSVITSNNDVIDVAAETFINSNSVLKIKWEKYVPKV